MLIGDVLLRNDFFLIITVLIVRTVANFSIVTGTGKDNKL